MKELLRKIKVRQVFLGVTVILFSHIAGLNIAIPLFLICITLYAAERGILKKSCNILNASLLFLIAFSTGYFISKNNLPPYYIPFSLVPMLAMLLFSNMEIAVVISLGASVSLAWSSLNPLQLIMLFLTSAVISAKFSTNARKRTTVIKAGLATGITQAVVFIATSFAPDKNTFFQGGLFIVNGIASSMIVLGILPVFEYLFKALTNISLLELADFHHPLLELLVQEAPGTYHHSLIVGNLSETASRAIGANPLLSRVGSYYHDIGKLQKPEYFSENQDREKNRHDELAPNMSKLVIMNHVKEGLELAKKYRINPVLIDFIEQHHGKSLVYYFYRRALENPEEDQEIQEEGFRYPGPKPNSKETAIVLLADSVEAAARAMKDPTPSKIEELVHKVINNKFIDGQLDECDLTLKDLEKISAVFIKLLCGIYHSRATYPEEENGRNNHKEPSKESPSGPKEN